MILPQGFVFVHEGKKYRTIAGVATSDGIVPIKLIMCEEIKESFPYPLVTFPEDFIIKIHQ